MPKEIELKIETSEIKAATHKLSEQWTAEIISMDSSWASLEDYKPSCWNCYDDKYYIHSRKLRVSNNAI